MIFNSRHCPKFVYIICITFISVSILSSAAIYAAAETNHSLASANISLISKQQGCSFSLYSIDGSLKAENIITNSQGTAIIHNLPEGKYYIRETNAPQGINLNTSKRPFSICQDDYGKTIKLSVETPDSSQTIFVTSKIKANNINFSNGHPIVEFEARNISTGNLYRTHINFSQSNKINPEGYLQQTTCFGNLPIGTYSISSSNGLRFSNLKTSTITLTENQNAFCSFIADNINSSECSDTQNTESILSTEKIPVSIAINNPNKNVYKLINKSEITVTVTYSNGTTKTVSAENNPNIRFLNDSISANDVGKTICPSIEYIENGIAISKQFYVDVQKWPVLLAVSSSEGSVIDSLNLNKITATIQYCDGTSKVLNGTSPDLSYSQTTFSAKDICDNKFINVTYCENNIQVNGNFAVSVLKVPVSISSIQYSRLAIQNKSLHSQYISANINYNDGTIKSITGDKLSFTTTFFPDMNSSQTIPVSYCENNVTVNSSFVFASSAPSRPTILRNPEGNAIAPGTAVNISANGSIDSDGDSISYVWDGRPSESYVYDLGKHIVKVKAVDSTGAESQYSGLVFFVMNSNGNGGMVLSGRDSTIIENGVDGATIDDYTFTVPSVSGHSSSNDYGRVRGFNKYTNQWDTLDTLTTYNGVTMAGNKGQTYHKDKSGPPSTSSVTFKKQTYTKLEFYYYTDHNCMYNKSNITYSVNYYFDFE